MQKKIKPELLVASTVKTILIVSFIVFFGLILGAGYLAINKPEKISQMPVLFVSTPVNTSVVSISSTLTPGEISQDDLLNSDKDELLHKLFPNLSFKNGAADLTMAGDYYSGLKLYLSKSVDDHFINNREKNLLLIVQLDGMAHAGGLYHSYLGLYDKNGNLLTSSSVFPKSNINNEQGDDYYDFFNDKAQFGGDDGNFGFYECKGIKYILFVSIGCPNGSCCDNNARLFKINNGDFADVQIINRESLVGTGSKSSSMILSAANAAEGPDYGLRMILSPDDKILIRKVPPTSENDCSETDFKELKWDRNSCRFEINL